MLQDRKLAHLEGQPWATLNWHQRLTYLLAPAYFGGPPRCPTRWQRLAALIRHGNAARVAPLPERGRSMAAGDATPGRRRPDNAEPHELEPGDYSLTSKGDAVWICLPNGQHGRVDSQWTITVEDDDTITVNPSILNRGEHEWHGYLEHGVWREV